MDAWSPAVTLILLAAACGEPILELAPTGPRRADRSVCAQPVSDDAWLTFRAINESEQPFDSLNLTLVPPAGPYNNLYLRTTIPFGTRYSPGCYVRLPRHRLVGRRLEPLAYSFFGFTPQGGFFNYHGTYVGLEHNGIPADSAATGDRHPVPPGYRYTLRYRLVPYTRLDVPYETVFAIPERFGGSSVQFRFFNVSGSELTRIRVGLPDTLLDIPRLAPGDSTGYFEVSRAYRMVSMSFRAGADSIGWSPDDYLGEPWLPDGWYRFSLDTLHTRWFTNESIFVAEVRNRD